MWQERNSHYDIFLIHFLSARMLSDVGPVTSHRNAGRLGKFITVRVALNVECMVELRWETSSTAASVSPFFLFSTATSGEKQSERSHLRHGHSRSLSQTLTQHFQSKWTGGGRWRRWAVGWEVVERSGGVLGYNYVKNYLYPCFMICSGGVCFKVLPRDWQCVT